MKPTMTKRTINMVASKMPTMTKRTPITPKYYIVPKATTTTKKARFTA